MVCYGRILSLFAVVLGASDNVMSAESILDGEFGYTLRAQATYEEFRLTDSAANPGNRLARLPEQTTTGELRPDFSYTIDNINLQISPRFVYATSHIPTEPDGRRIDKESNLFINEWRAGFIGLDNWDFWVGRDALIWGPATSLTPSNPFFPDPGNTNPYRELGGRDFIAGSWLGPAGWTVSYFDNIGRGKAEQQPLEEFRHQRVLKIDWSGLSSYWSFNYAWREGRPDHFGAFYQATLGQALVSYADIGLNLRKTQLEPVVDSKGNWRFSEPDHKKLSGIAVVGLSYTSLSGSSINLEYLHNNQGWSKSQSKDFDELLQQAGARFYDGSNDAAVTLAQAAQPRSPLRNSHYLVSQYLNRDVIEDLDLIVRIRHDLDDGSTRWTTNIEWRHESLTLFGLGILNTGRDHTEAGQYFENQWLVGFRVLY